jgi:Flp pilus assembly protein TadG
MRKDRGQTLLEFAFVAPVLLVFLLALVDFGIAIDRRLVLDHAVREGARYASVAGDALDGNPATIAQVKSYTAAQSQGIVGTSAVQLCKEPNGAGPSDDGVRVTVQYTHDFVTGFASIFDLSVGSIVMNPKASARIEQPLAGALSACAS